MIDLESLAERDGREQRPSVATAKPKQKPLRRAPVKRSKSRVVVEVRSEPEGVYQLERVKCGKVKCNRCRQRPAHGPYWYLYQWQAATRTRTARLRSVYIGKELTRRTG
jgi:hypothetical protein